MNILHIDSCALGDHSSSRQFTAAAIALLSSANHNARVTYRDLAATPLSHVNGPLLQVMTQRWNPAIPMGAELRAESLQSALLLKEFLDADMVVFGAPMHNFSIPSTLKAWLDRVLHLYPAAAAERPELPAHLAVKRIMLVTSCGSISDQPEVETLMHYHEMQLQTVFNHLGVGQVEIVRTGAELDAALSAWQESRRQRAQLHAA